MDKSINSGQSLFEAVIAIAMVSIILIAVVSTAVISVRNSSYSRYKTLANKMSQETVEWLRGERDKDWDAFSARILSSPTWCMQTLTWTKIGTCNSTDYVSGTIFKREVELVTISAKEIEANITIYWSDAQGYHDVNLITYFTDWRDNK